MATIVNNPPQERTSGMGFLLGALVLLVLLVLLVMYLVPALRSGFGRGVTYNVPSKVDVNLNPGGAGMPSSK